MSNQIPQAPLIPGDILFQALETTSANFENIYLTNASIENHEIISNSFSDTIATLSNNQLVGLKDPLLSTDAVNKGYIDNKSIIVSTNVIAGSVVYNNSGSLAATTTLIFTDPLLTINGSIICTSHIVTNFLEVGNTTLSSSTVGYTLNLPSSIGTPNQLITNDGSGNLFWSNTNGPAGMGNNIQVNSNGAFGYSSNLTFDGSTLGINQINGNIFYANELNTTNGIGIIDKVTSHTVTILPPLSLPNSYNLSFKEEPTVANPALGVTTSGEIKWINNGISPGTDGTLIFNDNYSFTSSGIYFTSSTLSTGPINQVNGVQSSTIVFTTPSTTFQSIYVNNYYMYLTTSLALLVLDSQSMSLINTVPFTETIVDTIAINQTIYVLGQTSLYKIVQGSTSQLSLGLSNCLANRFTIQGQYAYVLTQGSLLPYNSFIIIDITSMTIVGINTEVPNCENVVISNDIAYIACSNSLFSLVILDCTDVKNPTIISKLQLNGINDLKIIGSVIIAIGTYFSIIDISNNINPLVISSITTITNLTSIILGINTVTISSSNGSIYIIDYSVITTPVIINTYTNSNLNGISLLIRTPGTINELYGMTSGNVLLINVNNTVMSTSLIGNILTNDLEVSTLMTRELSISQNLTTNILSVNKLNYANSYTINWTSITSFTINNSQINTNSIILPSISSYSGIFGFPQVQVSNISLKSFTLEIYNIDQYPIPDNTNIIVSYLVF